MAFRTQKISQMTPKGANLEATDLIEVSTIESGSYVTRSITGQEIIDAAVGNVDWGDIGGTLSAQTDLQSALDAKVPTSRTLTINGVTQDLSADRTFTISTGITIGSTAIASGVVGRVLFEGAGNVVQESGNLTWDNTNSRLALNGTLGKLMFPAPEINFSSRFNGIHFTDSTYATSYGYLSLSSGFGEFRMFAGSTYFPTFYSNGLERMRIPTTGNVLINTTTDAGFRLDVNGTARVSGQTTIAGTTNASAGLGRNTLINGTITATANNNVLVGLDIEPTFNTGAFTGVETLALRVTGFISNFTSSGATQIRIIGPSNSNKSLFFFNSSSTFASTRIYNQGTTNHLVFATGDSLSNPTDRFAIFASTGNVGINTTTDAGFRLDVNGTARVSGQLTATADAVINGVNIGIGAGSQVTNTRVGRLALNFNTTGIRNTSVGQEALYATTTGSNNSAFGRGAIAVNTTGGNNSALGQNALFNNTTGNNNTVIGNNSLFAHTTGDSNSVLGADTVSGNFSGSVILGRAATATADNQFVVGSSGTNAGSVTTETNTSTQVWNVVINGVARKILLA